MTMHDDGNHGLIPTDSSGLIRRMDQRLDLVNRLLGEIKSQEIRIDVEMARRFIQDKDSVDLSKAQILDDDAAEILSEHSFELFLNGLTCLSDAAASALSKYDGVLHLNGLMSLSDAAANALAEANYG